jgi:UDP-N-acetyl-D-glucosamine/UDP-N-acetyl-D-galactosamine dehydrogenase
MPFDQIKSGLIAGDATIAIVGLGYVGLPLAVEFAGKYRVVGFDIDPRRINELRNGDDHTREVDSDALRSATNLELTDQLEDIRDARVYIVTVPTPIDDVRRPDLRPLLAASHTVGQVLKAGDTVIYESTVYPGCTEEDCVPVLEAESGLVAAFEVEGKPNKPNQPARQFFVGYSPERINPGDKAHTVTTITKVTSGSTPDAAVFIDWLYASIVTAGTHKAASIRTAEAAKVIENTQRDVNIGLINELAMLFNRLGLDTHSVLEAAGTKWNFLPFRPGLVGGHCIGVDPYYLTHKAQQIGFHPKMILAGRRTNDGMGAFVAGETVKLMARKGCYSPGARVLILGLTFKENCPDLRNTRVIDVIRQLREYSLAVDVHDPWADPDEARDEYGIELISEPDEAVYAATILCVAHNEFKAVANPGIRRWMIENGVVYDLKHILPADSVDARL